MGRYLRMRASFSQGFTLIELIVTMAVASILLGVGVPSFLEAIRDGRLSSEATCLNLALLSARSEAVRRSADVTVCPYGGPDSCGTDWSKGQLVFTEGTGSAPTGDLDTATVEADSTVIRSCPPLHDDNSILAVASNNRSAGTATARQFIRYDDRGASNWDPGYFVICDEREAIRWKSLTVGVSGDVRNARRHADKDALADAFNRKIDTCN